MVVQEEIPYTKEEYVAMVKTIERLRKEKHELIDKAWNWVEDNILSSNQQDKSRLYYEQFKKYMKGE